MDNFYEKVNYNYEDVLSLIENEVEESIHLDFKEANALDKSEGKRKDISKDVSSFANSDGGIIVYGIKEINHKAHSITFIDGNIFTKEWLEQIINSSIQRRIQDLMIIPIRNNGNIEETIYIVKIPKSYDTPHLSKDKRFYKRFNFESVAMEEYEIRQLYGQKIKSKLLLNRWGISRIPESENQSENEKNYYKFRCSVSIVNDGDIPETIYKVNVYLINITPQLEITWHQKYTHYDYTWLEDKRVKISANGLCPVFPNEAVNVIRFEIRVLKENLIEAFKDIKIEVALFYPNGEDKYETTISDLAEEVINDELSLK